MRFLAWMLVGLSLAGARHGVAQSLNKRASSNPAACHAADVEIVYEGSDAATSHSISYIGLHNVSDRTCMLYGIPGLIFRDESGKQISVPYGRNADDFSPLKRPERLVRLTPGGFAYFGIATTTGDQKLHFAQLRAMLPGDDTPMFVGEYGRGGGLDFINVSAIVQGVRQGFAAPEKQVGISDSIVHRPLKQNIPATCPLCSVPASGPIPGLILTLHVPPSPPVGHEDLDPTFNAHFAVRNVSAEPIVLNTQNCTVKIDLTDSAGKTLTYTQLCEQWEGETDEHGRLLPGASMTSDLEMDAGTVGCRAGTFEARLSLETPEGVVRFQPVPFNVDSTSCSDSVPGGVAERATPDVRWTSFSSCGVRLGVKLFTGENEPPATGTFFTGSEIPMFVTGRPVGLKVYLDNLTDSRSRSPAVPVRFASCCAGQG